MRALLMAVCLIGTLGGCTMGGGPYYRSDPYAARPYGLGWFPGPYADRCIGLFCDDGGFFHRRFDPRIPPRAIVRRLERRDYDVHDVDRRGANYRVKATDPRGHEVRMLFDGRTGQLLRRKVVR